MEELIDRILAETRTIAVVGISDKPERPSHSVARYLRERGYRVIAVNPRISEVFGEKAYPDLASVPVKVDLVDVFRRSEEVGPIADAAIRAGASFFWMQEGVENAEAKARLEAAGIPVVMDRCVKKELAKRGR